MIGHRQMTLDDYLAMLRRHVWVIIIPTLVLPALAYGVSLFLPERFTSQTLVLIQRPQVPSNLVQPVVTDDLNQRLGMMQQQILSRTKLQPLIEKFGLYKDDVAKKVPMEDLIGRMRKAILVTPVKSITPSRQQQDEAPGFTISFTADNPRLAQLVCTDITSMFIEENLRQRTQRAEGTTEFLLKQVEEAKRTLDAKDARVAEFKRKYLGQLPGQEQSNMGILMGLTQQLEGVNQLLARTHQDKTYAESLLQQQISAWEAGQTGTNPQTLEQQLAAMKNTLITLEARYTRDHPDVKKQKADIAQLEKKIEEQNAAAKEKSPDKANTKLAQINEPPNIQQLRNQIHQYEVTLAENTRKQEQLQEQVKSYRARVEMSPLVEQQYNEILRDFSTAQQFYDDLKKKMSQSAVSGDLERQQQSEQFRLWDPPSLPEKPTFPNRLLFAGVGFAGGLGLGLILALLLELKDKAIRTDRDVEVLLQLPTLAIVPSVSNGLGTGRGGLFARIRKTDERAQPRLES